MNRPYFDMSSSVVARLSELIKRSNGLRRLIWTKSGVSHFLRKYIPCWSSNREVLMARPLMEWCWCLEFFKLVSSPSDSLSNSLKQSSADFSAHRRNVALLAFFTSHSNSLICTEPELRGCLQTIFTFIYEPNDN